MPAAVLSLLCAAGSIIVGVRSFFVGDGGEHREISAATPFNQPRRDWVMRSRSFASHGGAFDLDYIIVRDGPAQSPGYRPRYFRTERIPYGPNPGRARFGFNFEIISTTDGYSVGHGVAMTVPYWALVLITGVPPLLWLRRRRIAQTRGRLAAGQCVQCGYDLRGSPDRCPECGTAATKSATTPHAADQEAMPAPRTRPRV